MKTISQVVRITGTAAERALLLDKDVDDNTIIEFSETDTGDKYEWDGNSLVQTHSAGSARVQTRSDMPIGNQHIREEDALNTTAVTFDWSALPNGVCAVTIWAVNEAAAAVPAEVAVCCVDPPNATIRDAWLTAADSLAADSQRIPIIANGEPLTMIFRDADGNLVGVDYIGIKLDIGADNIRVFAIGVEASA